MIRRAVLPLLPVLACGGDDLTSCPPPPAAPSPTAIARSDVHVDIDGLAGRWRVVTSTGNTSLGHVFVNHVGEVVEVDGDTLAIPDATTGGVVQKTLIPLGGTMTGLALSIRHRGHAAGDVSGTANQRGVLSSKGWSRVALASVEGTRLTLALDFPQHEVPRSLTGNGRSVEVVVLERHRIDPLRPGQSR